MKALAFRVSQAESETCHHNTRRFPNQKRCHSFISDHPNLANHKPKTKKHKKAATKGEHNMICRPAAPQRLKQIPKLPPVLTTIPRGPNCNQLKLEKPKRLPWKFPPLWTRLSPVHVGRLGGVAAENNTKGPAGTILSSIGPVSLDGGLDSSSLILHPVAGQDELQASRWSYFAKSPVPQGSKYLLHSVAMCF